MKEVRYSEIISKTIVTNEEQKALNVIEFVEQPEVHKQLVEYVVPAVRAMVKVAINKTIVDTMKYAEKKGKSEFSLVFQTDFSDFGCRDAEMISQISNIGIGEFDSVGYRLFRGCYGELAKAIFLESVDEIFGQHKIRKISRTSVFYWDQVNFLIQP